MSTMPLKGICVSSYWTGRDGRPACAGFQAGKTAEVESGRPSGAEVLGAVITCIICEEAGAQKTVVSSSAAVVIFFIYAIIKIS